MIIRMAATIIVESTFSVHGHFSNEFGQIIRIQHIAHGVAATVSPSPAIFWTKTGISNGRGKPARKRGRQMRIKKRTLKRDIDMARLSEKIIEYRRNNNVSMGEFAELSGISLRTVFKVENRLLSTIYRNTRRSFQNIGFEI